MTDGVVFRSLWLGAVGIFKFRSMFSPTRLTAATWTLLEGKKSAKAYESYSEMDRDDLNVLPAFMAVAEQRSFTTGAKRLGVSQSAVSHAVRGLEEEIGVRLLAAPTEAGDPAPTCKAPAMVRVLERWCQPFPGFFMYYASASASGRLIVTRRPPLTFAIGVWSPTT
jgi:hypothetical protein